MSAPVTGEDCQSAVRQARDCLGGGPEKGYKPYGKRGIKKLIAIAPMFSIWIVWMIFDSFGPDFGQKLKKN